MDQQPKVVGKPFQPGQSGNPNGRPRVASEIKALAREHAPKAFQRVVQLLESDDERVAFVAAQEILNRAYGKPTQFVDVKERKDLVELSDGELVEIIRASRARIVEATPSQDGPDQIH